jgi:DnaJ-class molecular chaperone
MLSHGVFCTGKKRKGAIMKRPIPTNPCDDCGGSGVIEYYSQHGICEDVCEACHGVGEDDVDTCRECGCRVEVLTAEDCCIACDVSIILTEASEFHHSSRQRELAMRIADVINGEWAKPDMANAKARSQAILAALNLGA